MGTPKMRDWWRKGGKGERARVEGGREGEEGREGGREREREDRKMERERGREGGREKGGKGGRERSVSTTCTMVNN